MAWYAFQVILRVRICSLNAHFIILFVMCICGGLGMIEVEVTGNIELVVSVSMYVGVLE